MLDSVVTHGDGIFETVLVRDGTPIDLAEHCQRLTFSGVVTGILSPEPAEWQPVVDALLATRGAATSTPVASPGADEAMLRLTVTRSGARFATLGPVPTQVVQQRGGIAVILAPDPFAREAPYGQTLAKSLSYATNLAVRRWAADRGADDVIFTAPSGTISESPTATVVLAVGDRLITPAAPGVLPPVTAARLSPLSRPVTAQDLYAADGIYLVSALRLAAPVLELDGRRRAHDPALTQRLQARLVE